MKPFLFLLALLCLGPLYAFGQTKDETIAYLKSEYRSFESRGYLYRELTFAPKGDAFTLRRAKSGEKEYLVSFDLKDVEIYRVTLKTAKGINRYQVRVRNRGRDTGIVRDGRNFAGALKISPSMENLAKCRSLVRAFDHLIALTTGRKNLFSAN